MVIKGRVENVFKIRSALSKTLNPVYISIHKLQISEK